MADNISEAEIRTILSRNLKRLRTGKKLSQLSLAVKAGLTHNFINDIENGKKWLSPKTLAALASVLETEIHEFFMPETVLPDQEAATLQSYLDNLTGDVLRMVADLKGRYFQMSEEGD
jgi:transcriptional regulator with XRE-family HTH domain